MAARDELGSTDGRIGSATGLVDVTTDIRIAKQSMDPKLRHDEAEWTKPDTDVYEETWSKLVLNVVYKHV